MDQGARFRLPKTLDEDPDVDIQGIPWTLTQSEWTFVIVAAGSGFMLGQMLGSGIASVAFLVILPLGTAQFITRYKSRLDAVSRQSWLFDLRFQLALGSIRFVTGRGWMPYRQGRQVLSADLGPLVSPFAAGARTPGEDLTLSRPWMRHRQPGIPMRPLVMPRRLRELRLGVDRTPAPAWWMVDGEAREADPRPTIPVTTVYRIVSDIPPAPGM